MYLMILFHIIGDLFRDRELSGWWKALWMIALIVFPFLTALIYLIARGRGMAERQAGEIGEKARRSWGCMLDPNANVMRKGVAARLPCQTIRSFCYLRSVAYDDVLLPRDDGDQPGSHIVNIFGHQQFPCRATS